jgi:Phage tail tube protein
MSGLIAVGVSKQLVIAKETTFATAALNSSGQLMRRTTSNVDLSKKTYKSTEIRPDYQFSDFRHGTRSITGTISDELSVGTWNLFMASVMRQAWQKPGVTAATAITAEAGSPQFTRSTGSFLTDGFMLGDVVQFEGFATGLANNANNFFITGITALTMTGIFLNGAAVVADSGSATVSVATMGSKTWMPLTNQTRDSYTIEHYFSDIGQSELFTGCRVSQMAVKLPSTGLATIDFPIMGIDAVEGTSQYFTAPAAPSNGQILAAVNGAMFMGGQKIAVVTSLDFTINGNMTTGDVVGSNVAPDIFPGSMDVTGTMSAYFEDETFQSAFFNEAEVSIVIALTTDSSPNAAFQVFTFPRCKLNGATKNDGQVGIVQTVPFVALLNNLAPAPGSLVTTMSIQDSTISTSGSLVALG